MRKRKARAIACIYVFTIFGLAMLPGPQPTADEAPVRVLDLVQNLLHIPLYGGLAFTLIRAARADATSLSPRMTTCIVLTGLLVAVIDEWIQSHVPGRLVSWGDLSLDLVGLTSVAVAFRTRVERQQNENRRV